MHIRDYLKSRHVPFETILHPPASNASQLAQRIRVPGRQVAKGVLLKAGEGYVLAVLPSTARIDLARLATLLNETGLVLASEDEAGSVFDDCERGALPPFGHLYGVRTLVDPSLAGASEIVCAGNSRHEGVRLRFRDYEVVEKPQKLRFAVEDEPKRTKDGRRQAG